MSDDWARILDRLECEAEMFEKAAADPVALQALLLAGATGVEVGPDLGMVPKELLLRAGQVLERLHAAELALDVTHQRLQGSLDELSAPKATGAPSRFIDTAV